MAAILELQLRLLEWSGLFGFEPYTDTPMRMRDRPIIRAGQWQRRRRKRFKKPSGCVTEHLYFHMCLDEAVLSIVLQMSEDLV
ncbi:hypothetical protein MRX96_002934 [Rhipicephalus microplus]